MLKGASTSYANLQITARWVRGALIQRQCARGLNHASERKNPVLKVLVISLPCPKRLRRRFPTLTRTCAMR